MDDAVCTLFTLEGNIYLELVLSTNRTLWFHRSALSINNHGAKRDYEIVILSASTAYASTYVGSATGFPMHCTVRSEDYCRVLIKSTPLRDRDTPDEIFVLSPYLEDCDKGKISSSVAAFCAISSIFLAKLVVAISHQGENYIYINII